MVTIPKKTESAESKIERIAVNSLEAAKMPGISPRTLFTLTKEKRIPHVRAGKRVLYPIEGLQKFCAGETR